MSTLAQLEQAFESLRTAFRGVAQEFDKLSSQIDAGATLEEAQGRIDYIRSQFDQLYTQVESLRAQALTIDPRPDALIARLDNSLNVNRPTNYQALGTITTKAGQNTNKRNAETADKAAADQGPQTDSAGAEVTAEGAATQAPAAPAQQQAANGAVTTASTTTQTSNAEKFTEPGTTTVQPSATALPGPASPAASGAVPPATGTQIASAATAASSISPGQSEAALSYIYKATTVISTFERGRFTQELEGVLLIFPDPPRKTVYRDSDDNLAYEYTADDNLGFEGRPGGTGPSTPPVLTGPVVKQPNAQNLAQAPESSTGEPAPVSESTDTVAPAETAPATSASEPVAAPPANQPPPFKIPGGYVTAIPPGVTQDRNSGAWIYRDAAGEEVMFTANTNEALAAKIRAYDTGDNVRYTDYDSNVGWVYETFDPNTQTRNIVGPAPNPYEQSGGTAAPSQNMAREN